MMGYPGYGYGDGVSAIIMMSMMLFGLLFLLGITGLIVWAAVRAGSPRQPMYPYRQESPCEIARLRYAKGEITKEQFEEICRVVGG